LLLGSHARLAAWLVRHPFCLTCALARGGNLLRPTQAHKKSAGQCLQCSLALIIGEKKFTAQIIPKGFPHVFVRRKELPKTVYTI